MSVLVGTWEAHSVVSFSRLKRGVACLGVTLNNPAVAERWQGRGPGARAPSVGHEHQQRRRRRDQRWRQPAVRTGEWPQLWGTPRVPEVYAQHRARGRSW